MAFSIHGARAPDWLRRVSAPGRTCAAERPGARKGAPPRWRCAAVVAL